MGMLEDFTTIKQQIKSGTTCLDQGINKFKGIVDQYIDSIKDKMTKYCKSMPACEECDDGYLLKIVKEENEFYGCSNFPRCKSTQSVSRIDCA